MHGTAHEKARTKARELTDTLQKKKPDALFYRITSLNFSEQPLELLVSGQGLFSSKYIVLLDSVFDSKEIKEEVVGALKEIAESENVFIFLEKEIDKKTLEKLDKYATKVQVFNTEEIKKKNEFNPFALSDAFLSRDKKRLWEILLETKKRGVAPEETHGLLWWQVKALALATEAKTAEESDLSPFVFSKAKRAEKLFSKEEINTMLFDLVTMYHEAHRGNVDLWVELEKWGLRI
ncbi:MAG: hypothetical protein WC629_00105 [Candidatus Paceibacterota bacterium]